jgi:ABC-2 type transport system permease protein
MLPIIFVTPLIQLIILANAATFEIKNITFNVVDLDQSSFSRELISKFTASNYFTFNKTSFSVNKSEEDFRTNKSKLIIYIPKDFEKDFINTGNTKIQLIIKAEDGNAAVIIQNYSERIIRQFNSSIIPEWQGVNTWKIPPMINIAYSNWYNPRLNYKTYMVPGILVVLVTIVGMFLTGMNIAREKEIGTIEQLKVTPIKKYQFIIGKLMPFWIIALFELAFGLFVAKIIFNIPILGSILLIFFVASLYLFVVLGIAWFFMVVFILMGGIFTPIESMPTWAQNITFFNPLAHFSKAIRMIMLKGSDLIDVIQTIYFLLIYAAIILSLAVWRYRKVS